MNGRGVSYIVVRVVGLLHPLPRIDGDNSGRPAIIAASRLTGDAPDHRETDSNGITVVQGFQIGANPRIPARVETTIGEARRFRMAAYSMLLLALPGLLAALAAASPCTFIHNVDFCEQ